MAADELHFVSFDVTLVNGSLHGYEIESDRDSLRRLARQVAPYSAVLDRATLVVGEDTWDSEFRLVGYTPEEACFLAEWGVPPELVPSLSFKLAGWRRLDEDPDTAAHIMSSSVELLDSATVATFKHHDVAFANEANRTTMTVTGEHETAAYQTAMRVCFPSPQAVIAPAQYLVISVAVDEYHRTGAAWRLVSPAQGP